MSEGYVCTWLVEGMTQILGVMSEAHPITLIAGIGKFKSILRITEVGLSESNAVV